MTQTPTDVEIKRAAQLSVTEIGLGSLGHALKVPLTGHLLSLNQLGFLLNALNVDRLPRASTFEISAISAVLKSFSPAGSKLGAMFSIAMQGFLFFFCTLILGGSLIGQLFGAVLLSLWAFVQPFITLYALYGSDLVRMGFYYYLRMSGELSFLKYSFIIALAFVASLKTILSLFFVFYSYFRRRNIILLKNPKLSSLRPTISSDKKSSVMSAVLRDLTRPLFVLSFVLMSVFIWQQQGSLSHKIWLSMRPLATTFVLFYVLRNPAVAAFLQKQALKSPAFARFYAKAQAALEQIDQRLN